MKNLLPAIAFILIVCVMFLLFPINASADFDDELTICINIYQGETYLGSTNMQAYPGEDLCLTSLNEIYGEPQSATVMINGTPGMALTWSFPDYLTYVTSSFGWAEIGDEVEINIYYPASETEPEPEIIVYGSLELELFTDNDDSPANYYIQLNGIKGVDTFEEIYYFPENGILILENLDVSYNWQYQFNEGNTWNVNFDENNYYYNQLSVQSPPEIKPIEVGNEHTVYVTWEYCAEAGGEMVNGHADNAFVAGTTSFTAISGEPLDLITIQQNPAGGTYVGDNLVQIGNNFYRISDDALMGDNIHSAGEVKDFIMIDDDLHITFTYIFDHAVETEVEKEVIKEVEVPVEVEVVKEIEVPVEVEKIVEKEVPVEVVKETVKETIIKEETVKEVPVIQQKETIKETVKEVPVIQQVTKETIKEVPVEKEIVIENTVARPVPVNVPQPTNTPVVVQNSSTKETEKIETNTSEKNNTEELTDSNVPLASPEDLDIDNNATGEIGLHHGTWSIINLCLFFTSILGYFYHRDNYTYNVITGFFVFINIVIYLITQDFLGKMVLINEYTWTMVIIFACIMVVKCWQILTDKTENNN